MAKINCEALAPVTAMLVIDSAALPVLVMVTACNPLQVSTVVPPNAMLVGASVTGVEEATPVPVNAMLCGEPVALSVMVMAADSAPVEVG